MSFLNNREHIQNERGSQQLSTYNNSFHENSADNSSIHKKSHIENDQRGIDGYFTPIKVDELEVKLNQMGLNHPVGIDQAGFQRFLEEALGITHPRFVNSLFKLIADVDPYITRYDMFQLLDVNQNDWIDLSDRKRLLTMLERWEGDEMIEGSHQKDQIDGSLSHGQVSVSDIDQLIIKASLETDGNRRLSYQDLRTFIELRWDSADPTIQRLVELAQILKRDFALIKGSNQSIDRAEAIDYFQLDQTAVNGFSQDEFMVKDIRRLIRRASIETDGNRYLSMQDLKAFIDTNRDDDSQQKLVGLAAYLVEHFNAIKGDNSTIKLKEAIDFMKHPSNEQAVNAIQEADIEKADIEKAEIEESVWSVGSDRYWSYHSSARGRISNLTEMQGVLTYRDEPMIYSVVGGVITTRDDAIQATAPRTGWTQLLTIGASDGGGHKNRGESWDEALMVAQDFVLLGVEGTDDKRVEMWGRIFDANRHHSDVIITGDAKEVAFSLHTIEQKLNIPQLERSFERKVIEANYKTETLAVKTDRDWDFTLAAIFFDDTVKINNMPDNAIQFYGQGDGDGFFVWIGGEQSRRPSHLSIENLAPRGRQDVSAAIGLD